MNVVSFLCPRPDHPYYRDYRPYLDLLRESCARYGHRHLVLTDDPSLEDAYVVPDVPASLMKAVLWCQWKYLADPQFANEPTLLVGADCVLGRDPEAFDVFGTDLVITTGDFEDCRMNCGAIYAPKPAKVQHVWGDAYSYMCETRDLWGDDQRALYRSVLRFCSKTPCGDLLSLAEVPVDPWNLAPDFPGDDRRDAFVLHFRGPRKDWMERYCRAWLGLGVTA